MIFAVLTATLHYRIRQPIPPTLVELHYFRHLRLLSRIYSVLGSGDALQQLPKIGGRHPPSPFSPSLDSFPSGDVRLSPHEEALAAIR